MRRPHPLELEFKTLCANALENDTGFSNFELGDPIVREDCSFRPTLIGYEHGKQIHEKGYWQPVRETMVDLAARRTEVRSRYWDPATQQVYYPAEDYVWIGELRKQWPGKLDCEVSIGVGWIDLLIAQIEWHHEIGAHFSGSQIKEKWGCLRTYGSSNHPIGNFEIYAEYLSYWICERCGNPGELRTKGWHQTLCDAHFSGKPAVICRILLQKPRARNLVGTRCKVLPNRPQNLPET
jgi:hypothetical protein